MDTPVDGYLDDCTVLRRPLLRRAPEEVAATQLSAFMRHCAARGAREFADYAAFERYAIEHATEFWTLLVEWSGLLHGGQLDPAITDPRCEFASFFPRMELNYVENLLRGDRQDDSRPALTGLRHGREAERWSRAELRERVAALAAALAGSGLGAGSRVAIIAGNTPNAVLGCLGAAAIGCTVSTAAPELGADALIDRLGQVEPELLMVEAVDAAAPGAAQQRERLLQVLRALPRLRGVLLLEGAAPEQAGVPVHQLADWLERHRGAAPRWPRLPFNHPLFILFTSGTTGLPKCLVHGAGGTLLEHLKEHLLHGDLRAADRLFFHTSTGWMMWNWQLSALACGAELVLYDGPLTGADCLWRIVAEQRVTVFGTSPAYLQMCERAGWRPDAGLDFSALRAVLSTGSTLYPRQQEWVWRRIKPLAVQSISGGTDIVGCFVLGNPNVPAYSAECQSRSLGLDVRALDADEDGIGELVCANPFPSRPLGLLNDPDGLRFHNAYFAANPGVWTHGDRIEFTAEGSARMHGRSDSVLKIRGIRIGPAEIYRILEGEPEISEAMAVEQETAEEVGGGRLVLLLVLRNGAVLDGELRSRIRRLLAQRGSPAHVPALIFAVDELPTTHSGKRSERSAREALSGKPVRNRGALRNPECLDALRALAAAEGPAAAAGEALTLIDQVRAAWEEVLGIAPIGEHENYFDLGGDSLKALRLIALLKQRTGRELPLAAVFAAPTVHGQCGLLQGAAAGTPAYQPLVLLNGAPAASAAPPLFIVHGVGGSVMELRELALRIGTDRPVYGLQARGFGEGESPLHRVEDLAAQYLDAVRLIQPQGPYYLAGYSFGGLVAHEMACQLRRQGQRVGMLGILDTTVSERFWPLATWAEYLSRRLGKGLGELRGLSLAQWPAHCRALGKSLSQRIRRRKQEAAATDEQPQAAQLPGCALRVRQAHLKAAAAYRPRSNDVTVSLFRSDLQLSHLCDPYSIWRRLAPEVRVHAVGGNHESMIGMPNVTGLARQIAGCLDS
ncbi:MAG TPA: acetoacetate--CoA ligase [Nevskia sp.]|nr:acetoacetate--CoA ligase [Nevskia sp.]